MNLFRSEEHITRWLAGRAGGATMPLTTLVDVAYAWFGDRLSPDWRPRTREESQAILTRAGLAGDFWQLP